MCLTWLRLARITWNNMEQKDTKRIRVAVELDPEIVLCVDRERKRIGCTRAQYLRTLVMERVSAERRPLVANGRA